MSWCQILCEKGSREEKFIPVLEVNKDAVGDEDA